MSFSSTKDANGSGNREAKGFLLLLIMLIIPFLLQYGYRYLFKKEVSPSFSEIRYIQEDCEPAHEYTSYSYSNTNSKSNRKDKEVRPYAKSEQQIESVNINTADSIALEKLPGIGFKLASRIIKYRTLLGGYIKVEQLKEVYGLPVETYDKIKDRCLAYPAEAKKIQGDSLWNKPYKIYHPYLNKDLKAEIATVKKRESYSPELLRSMIQKSNDQLSSYILF